MLVLAYQAVWSFIILIYIHVLSFSSSCRSFIWLDSAYSAWRFCLACGCCRWGFYCIDKIRHVSSVNKLIVWQSPWAILHLVFWYLLFSFSPVPLFSFFSFSRLCFAAWASCACGLKVKSIKGKRDIVLQFICKFLPAEE